MMKTLKWICVTITLIFILGIIVMVAPPRASAHDWYAPQCCNGSDCKPVDASEVEELDWEHVRDRVTGQILTGNKIKQSQDGGWHVCNRGGVRTNETLCIYRPVGSY